jgi:hypothetical protein
MSSIGHSAQDYVSGMGTVQIRYGVGGSVGYCKTASCLQVESGVPRDSESAGRPPLLDLERPRLASRRIDMEAAWNDGRSFVRMDEKA